MYLCVSTFGFFSPSLQTHAFLHQNSPNEGLNRCIHHNTNTQGRRISAAFLSFTLLQTISKKPFQASVVLAYRWGCVCDFCVRANVFLGLLYASCWVKLCWNRPHCCSWQYQFFLMPPSALPRFWGEPLRLNGPYVEVVVNGARLLCFSALTISSQLHSWLSADLRRRRKATTDKRQDQLNTL